MALSQNSTILVSDISTALASKQDALGYTPVKSVNGTSADSSGNVSISVSAPVTSVNGMTGAVTISSVNKATAVTAAHGKYTTSSTGTITLPSGGTWTYVINLASNSSFTSTGAIKFGSASGGSTISNSASYYAAYFAVRSA